MKTSNIIQINILPGLKAFVEKKDLESTASKILAHLKIEESEISITLIDNKSIREFNNQYRGIDMETDVLSFTGYEINPENGHRMLGDILISIPMAQKQAADLDHSLEDEIKVLMIHGILHLLGYDHEKKSEEEQMFTLQAMLFKAVK
jgi:probable rRNA maturation factor